MTRLSRFIISLLNIYTISNCFHINDSNWSLRIKVLVPLTKYKCHHFVSYIINEILSMKHYLFPILFQILQSYSEALISCFNMTKLILKTVPTYSLHLYFYLPGSLFHSIRNFLKLSSLILSFLVILSVFPQLQIFQTILFSVRILIYISFCSSNAFSSPHTRCSLATSNAV